MKNSIIAAAVLVALAGCTPTPQKYASTLKVTDPKFNSAECKQIRLEALNFDDKVGGRMAIGAASGLLLGPFGLPLAAAADHAQEEKRKAFAREMHLRCSSTPLPDKLKETATKPASPKHT